VVAGEPLGYRLDRYTAGGCFPCSNQGCPEGSYYLGICPGSLAGTAANGSVVLPENRVRIYIYSILLHRYIYIYIYCFIDIYTPNISRNRRPFRPSRRSCCPAMIGMARVHRDRHNTTFWYCLPAASSCGRVVLQESRLAGESSCVDRFRGRVASPAQPIYIYIYIYAHPGVCSEYM